MYTDNDTIKAYDNYCSEREEHEEEERDLSENGFYIDTDVEVARIDGGLGAIYDAETDETVGWYRLNWNRYDKRTDAVITLVSSRTSRAERDSKWLHKMGEAVLAAYPHAQVRYWL